MIDKEELLERIENTLTTRMIKQLFIGVVEDCGDVPIPKKKDGTFRWTGYSGVADESYLHGWNDCVDAMRGKDESNISD